MVHIETYIVFGFLSACPSQGKSLWLNIYRLTIPKLETVTHFFSSVLQRIPLNCARIILAGDYWFSLPLSGLDS